MKTIVNMEPWEGKEHLDGWTQGLKCPEFSLTLSSWGSVLSLISFICWSSFFVFVFFPQEGTQVPQTFGI